MCHVVGCIRDSAQYEPIDRVTYTFLHLHDRNTCSRYLDNVSVDSSPQRMTSPVVGTMQTPCP
ncbi:hypothetical protein M3J09_011718 [Ascochyta lentis]